MKQSNLFGDEFQDKEEKKYSSSIQAPVYEPKNSKPFHLECFNDSKTRKLINEIESLEIPKEDKDFLIAAAHRHTVFNYEKVADYYAHSNPIVQNLMEKSGLVIIDFERAITLGYVKLCEEIKSQYLEDYGE